MGNHLDDSADILSSSQAPADPHQGYAGPVPGRAPGKRTRTAGIPPRKAAKDSSGNGLDAVSEAGQRYIEHGGDFNPKGALWDDSPESDKKRQNLDELLMLRLPVLFDDMHAAIERVLLDVNLSTEQKSLVVAIISFALDQLTSGLISKLSVTLKTLGVAAQVTKGVSEMSGQATPVLAKMILHTPAKSVEAAAKLLAGQMKKRIEADVGAMAGSGFAAEKAQNKSFLQGVQNGFSNVHEQLVAVYTDGTDVEKVALLVMLENRPSLAEFEAQFRDLLERYGREQISKIGKKSGITEAKYTLVCIEAYGQKLYLNVLTAEGPDVGKKPRMVGAGGTIARDITVPDKPAELIAVISPDLVETAIANNGGTFETVSMTWEEYRDGKSPVPTLDLKQSTSGNLFGPEGKFKAWLLEGYKAVHGGKMPPPDPFWFTPDNDSKDPEPVTTVPQPSANNADDSAAPSDDWFGNLF